MNTVHKTSNNGDKHRYVSDDAEWDALIASTSARATLAEAVLIAPPPELDQRILAMAKAAIEEAEDAEWEMLLASDTARGAFAEAVLVAPPPELDERILAMVRAALETEQVVQVVAIPTVKKRQLDATARGGQRHPAIRIPAGNARHSEGNVVYWNFRPLFVIDRLAADDGEIAPLPDPGRPLESADGRFRLWIRPAADTIHITLEALGFASDAFAHRRLGLASAESFLAPGADQPVRLHSDIVIAQFLLDQDGEGECYIPNTIEMRQALLRPVIGLIDEED